MHSSHKRPLSSEYYESIARLVDKTVTNADKLLVMLQSNGRETTPSGRRSRLPSESKHSNKIEISKSKPMESSSSRSSSCSTRGFQSYVDTPSRLRKDADSFYSSDQETGKTSRSSSTSRRTPAPSLCARDADVPDMKSKYKPFQKKEKEEKLEPLIKQDQDDMEEERNIAGKNSAVKSPVRGSKILPNDRNSTVSKWPKQEFRSSSRSRQALKSPLRDATTLSSRSCSRPAPPLRSSSNVESFRLSKAKCSAPENATVKNVSLPIRSGGNNGKLITIMNANNIYISCGCCRTAKQHTSKHGNFYLTIGRSSEPPVLYDDSPSATCHRDKETKGDSNSSYANEGNEKPRAHTPMRSAKNRKTSPPEDANEAANDDVENAKDRIKKSSKSVKASEKSLRSRDNLPKARTPPRSPVSRRRRSPAGFSPLIQTASSSKLNASDYFDEMFDEIHKQFIADEIDALMTARPLSPIKPSNTTSFNTTVRMRDHQNEMSHKLTIQAEIDGKILPILS